MILVKVICFVCEGLGTTSGILIDTPTTDDSRNTMNELDQAVIFMEDQCPVCHRPYWSLSFVDFYQNFQRIKNVEESKFKVVIHENDSSSY